MLELSTKYALSVISYLNQSDSREYLAVPVLAKKTRIPAAYLSKVVKKLVSCGFLESRRGMSGGVRIPDAVKTISIFDVCLAFEDPICKQDCFLTKSKCSLKNPCSMHKHWQDLRNQIRSFLVNRNIN